MANIFGTGGADTLGNTGLTTGSDRVFGQDGNDTLVYTLASAGGFDRYFGGTGTDTIEFRLTAAEWGGGTTAAAKAILNFKAAVDTRAASGELPLNTGYTPLTFGPTKTLTVFEVERVRVFADGVLVSGGAPVSLAGNVTEAGVGPGPAFTPVAGSNIASFLLPTTDANGNPIAADAVWSVAPNAQNIYGSMSVGASSGVWTYTLNNADPDTQKLQTGQTKVLTFQMQATSPSQNSVVFQYVNVTINGTDDRAEATVVSTDVQATERGGLSNGAGGVLPGDGAGGTLSIVNVDGYPNGSAVPLSTVVAGKYGNVTITRTGVVDDLTTATWTYAVNETNAAVQALQVGQTLVDTVTLSPAQLTAFNGAAPVFTVTINGADDLPSVSIIDTVNDDPNLLTYDGQTVEAGGIQNGTAGDASASGKFLVGDPDNAGPITAEIHQNYLLADADPLKPAQFKGYKVIDATTVEAKYGTFQLQATGEWTYTLNDNDADTEALDTGDIATEMLIVQAQGSGGVATNSVTVSIVGTDDATKTITNTPNGWGSSVTEPSDPDNRAGGTLTPFDPDDVLIAPYSGANGGTGVLLAVDRNPANPVTAQVVVGKYGNFTLNGDTGTWSYVLAPAGTPGYTDVNTLRAETNDVETMTVVSADGGATTSVQVVVNGMNDAAVMKWFAIDTKAFVDVNGNPAPIDHNNDEGWRRPNDATSFPNVIEAGGFNNGFNPDSITSGIVKSTDVDNTEGITPARPAGWDVGAAQAKTAGEYGDFTFNYLTGEWTYQLRNGDANVQALTAADVKLENLDLTSPDGTSHTITVTVVGSNDRAAITINPAVPQDYNVKEAGGVANGVPGDPTAGGDLNVTDVDGAGAFTEARFAAPTGWTPTLGGGGTGQVTGKYGDFTFNPNTGEWSYQIGEWRAQPLVEGQTVTETLLVYSQDYSASQAITVTVTGSYDAAQISNTPSVTGGEVTAEGFYIDRSGTNPVFRATAADYDAGGTLSVLPVPGVPLAVFQPVPAPALQGTYGWFTFDAATGAWAYRLDNEDPDTLALRSQVDATGAVHIANAQDYLSVSSFNAATNYIETYTIRVDVKGAETRVDLKGTPGTSYATVQVAGFPNASFNEVASAAAPKIVYDDATKIGTLTYMVRDGDGQTLRLQGFDPFTNITAPFGTVTVNDAWNSNALSVVRLPTLPASDEPGVVNVLLRVSDGTAAGSVSLNKTMAQGTVGNDSFTMVGSNGGLAGGYDGDDQITGTAGADFMDGGNGYDTLNGGLGADTLVGAAGNDLLDGDLADASADWLDGGAGYDTLLGGAGNDVLKGGDDPDQLWGEAGNDRLSGGNGRDQLNGGADADTFVFALSEIGTGVDVVTDFEAGVDKLEFSGSQVLAGLTTAQITANEWFRAGAAAMDATDRLIYDATTGNLWYDADGLGGAAQQLVASLAPATAVVATDFVWGA